MQILHFFILFLSFGTESGSMNTMELKEQALEACNTPQEQVPEKYWELDIKLCKCTAELTDFETVISGDKEKIHKDWLKNTDICAKKFGATSKPTNLDSHS